MRLAGKPFPLAMAYSKTSGAIMWECGANHRGSCGAWTASMRPTIPDPRTVAAVIGRMRINVPALAEWIIDPRFVRLAWAHMARINAQITKGTE